jgi:hypothetical protein
MSQPQHLTLALALAVVCAGAEAALYRWVDDQGIVHYTDTLPPGQADKGHTEITEGGIRVRTVPPAKTPEELARERELERLRAQQERLLEEQRTADRVLLTTFRSDDDILMARDGKLATIDAMIQVTRNNIRRQQEWLAGLRREAADLERAGKPVPNRLRENITGAERAIGGAYETILQREHQKESIREGFERDLKRFRELKELPESTEPPAVAPVLENLVTCADADACDRLWPMAVAYAKKRAKTPVQTENEVIFITAPPANEQEISLILCRISDKDGPGASLFLDVQCRRSPTGDRTCQGAEVGQILAGFRPALLGADTSGD